MNIYSLEADANRYQNLELARPDEELDVLYRIKGMPLRQDWEPITVEVLEDDDQNKSLPPSDFPAFLAPVFSARAVAALEPLLLENGELLPLNCRDGEYYLFNVTEIIDALDEGRSDVVRFSAGKVMDIKQFAFHENRLAGVDVFKIPQLPLTRVFVSDGFAHRVTQAGLTGFVFKKVWGNEQKT